MQNVNEKKVLKSLLGMLVDVDNDDSDFADFIKTNKLVRAYGSSSTNLSKNLNKLLHEQRLKHNSREASLCEIHQHFNDNFIEYAVIKGASFEKVIYNNCGFRDVGDIDILIEPNYAQKAHHILSNMGYKQQLGPSSGTINEEDRAAFVARIAQHRFSESKTPIKRFPYKGEYCPYVIHGKPTIELHDGFRDLPNWYTHGIIFRASKNNNCITEDITDVFVLLLLNTYENSESFYSNYFDCKLVLRDFLDLAYMLTIEGEKLNWPKIISIIKKLNLEDKFGVVLNNLTELFPGKIELPTKEIHLRKSLWGLTFVERLVNEDARKQAVLRIIKNDMSKLAARGKIGWHVIDEDIDDSNPKQPIAIHLLNCIDNLIIVINNIGYKDAPDNIAFAINFFDLMRDVPPLCMKIIGKLEHGRSYAYIQECDRLPDGILVWKNIGRSLQSEFNSGQLKIYIPASESCKILGCEDKVMTACVYDRHYENVYWIRSKNKWMLSGNVPIGFISLCSNTAVKNIYVDFPVCRYIISSNSDCICSDILSLFEESGIGMPLDCDNKKIRSSVIMIDSNGIFTLNINGESVIEELDKEKALGFLIQDITDWYVQEKLKDSMLCHAATCVVNDEVILLMGISGSGKTTIAAALSEIWPIRGDECACIDCKNATTWVDPLPISIKSDNTVIADNHLVASKGLKCYSDKHGIVYLHNREAFNFDKTPNIKRKIHAIVFPKYDKKLQYVELKKIDQANFVNNILNSLLGNQLPSVSFSSFIRMVSKHNIPILQIRYSSAIQAANFLVNHFQSSKEIK
jgi:adenylate kinase family enzyme